MNMSEIEKLEVGTKIKYTVEKVEEVRTIDISPLHGLIAQSTYGSYMPLNKHTMDTYKYEIERLDYGGY